MDMLQQLRNDNVDSDSLFTTTKRNGRLSAEGVGMWTNDEHERFIVAMEMYPNGPWRLVADYVGTRNARQTMTHAQKYKQKIARRQRGLRTPGRTPSHRSRQPSISESDSGSDISEERPYLPVVIRTRSNDAPRMNDLDSFDGSFLALHQQAQADDLWSDLDDDIQQVLSSVGDWLAPLDVPQPSSPRSPADQADDDTLWFDEYISMMCQPLDNSST